MNTDTQIIIPLRTKTNDKDLISKASKKTTVKKTTKSNTLIDKIYEIEETVKNHLGKYADDYEIISSKDEFQRFITTANKNDMVAIDTETTGLSPIMDKIVGMSLYTPNEKAVYIPINHIDYITEERLPNQLTEIEVKAELDKLTAKVIMFNAVFDIRVIRNQIGSYLNCFWDCYLASKLMNENEQNGGLKALHEKYILKGEDKEFSFGQLFNKISFDKIPINSAYVYAAHDAIITYELYEFQNKYLKPEGKNGLDKVYDVFMNIEMPCVEVIADMEDTGFALDMEYQKVLHEKYHKLLDENLNELLQELNKYADKFKKWQCSKEANVLIPKVEKDGTPKVDAKGNPQYEKTKKEKLPDELQDINLGSPTQLSILIYDIMGLKHNSKKDKATSTSEAALKSINNEFTNMLLEYRSFRKLIDTFIDNLPTYIEKDGRIHCKLNAYGARTGRFSCSDPNLQQIPSKNTEIRKLFIAPTNYREVEDDTTFIFKDTEEIDIDGNENWVFVKDLKVGDKIQDKIISDIAINQHKITITVV